MFIELLIGNDNLIEFYGLKNAVSDGYISSADVSATLNDENGDQVVGQNWPVTLNYVADSDGHYRAILEESMALSPGHFYQLIVDVVADGLHGHWETFIEAKIRS